MADSGVRPQGETIKTMTAKTATASKRSPRTIAGAISPAEDPARAQTLASYEAAIRLMQEGKFDKARTAFEKLLAAGAAELADRIRMYINACTAQLPDASSRHLLKYDRRVCRDDRYTVTLDEQIGKFIISRQAADMGDQNAFAACFHKLV